MVYIASGMDTGRGRANRCTHLAFYNKGYFKYGK